uniref:GBD/FH3 domain-containing protein n=1 Tax=Panagrolaimus sp. ES5 TaxID=591445 RepID=A0AC34GY59_9BILA
MLDSFVDKAWTCFNKISSAVERKPPDRKRKTKPKFDRSLSQQNIDGIDWICRPEKSSTLSDGNGTISRSFGVEKMPNPEKLEAAFIELLEELDLPIEKQKELQKQSAEKKWHMIVEQSNRRDQANCASTIARLTEFAANFPDRYDWPLLSRRLEGLSISLRTESFSFVQDFLDAGGVELLIALLNESRIRDASNVAVPLLSAFRTLLNSTAVRTTILGNQSALLSIAAALDFHNPKTKV